MKEEKPFDIDTIREQILQKKKAAEQELNSIIDNCDAENLLTIIMALALLRPVEDMIGDRYGHHASMIELLASKTISKFGDKPGIPVSPLDVMESFSLLEKCFFSIDSFLGPDKNGDSTSDSYNSAKIHSAYVRGNAYPEQTEYMIQQVMGPYNAWFERECGISPERAISICKAITDHAVSIVNSSYDEIQECGVLYAEVFSKCLSRKDRSLADELFLQILPDEKTATIYGRNLKHNEIISNELPVDLSKLNLEPAPSQSEIDGIKSLIGVSKSTVQSDGSIKRYPLYVLEDGRVLLSEYSNAMDQLWNAFDETAQKDQPFYGKRLQRKKAKWLEEKGIEILSRLFPEDSIYQSLDYPDPDKTGKATTELDIAVKWGPFLILCEAKAKKFRFDHVTGTPQKLRTDLKKNAEDAYSQCLRAMRHIEGSDEAVFTERKTGRKLVITATNTSKIYPISLSLHHLGGLATKLSQLSDLNLFQSNSFPFSICLSDLDTILKATITPDVFLHYIERRIRVLEDQLRMDGDEHDLFLAYLDSRLILANFHEPGIEDFSGVFFGGYSDQFDQMMMFERGYIETPPQIQIKVPATIQLTLDELRARESDDARWIAFSLLELDDRCLHEIALRMDDISQAELDLGIYRRFSFSHNDYTILIAGCNPAMPPSELYKWLLQKAAVEKYIKKTTKCIGLGIRARQTETTCECAVYLESKWEKDEMMESMVEIQPPFTIAPGSKLPGRNAPCVCGSGNKFKKCCLRKIEEHRRNMKRM